MNDMTARFEAIRDDLDRQVQERTKQVVRSEQLASVGFLAAGVAHEINNPLASIALCAESLEGRIARTARRPATGAGRPRRDPQLSAHDSERGLSLQGHHRTAARLLAHGRRHAAKHRSARAGPGRDRHGRPPGPLSGQAASSSRRASRSIAPVNPQELKQVVLNLITNGLDSLSPRRTVADRAGAEPRPGRNRSSPTTAAA